MTSVEPPSIVTTRRVVPNQQPIVDPGNQRIAIIGEAPGEDEENHHTPFVGKSGQFLTNILRDVGIDRQKCLMGNVCQARPPGNRIEAFDWNGPEIQGGLAKLHEDIRVYNPNIIVCLGGTPLRAADNRGKITKWRGSLFTCSSVSSPFYSRKCIASIHPAFVLREFSWFPLLKLDLKRAVEEGRSPTLILPQRELLTNLSASELCYLMDHWHSGLRCSVDIEGGLPEWAVNESVKKDSKKRRHIGWRCVSLAARPSKAVAIPWWKFDLDDHVRLLRTFAQLMSREDVPKVLQNSLYDSFVMAYGYRIQIRNIAEDVMLKGWEKYCELPKALSVQASIWTREPHWKDEEMYESTGENLAIGCCKDTAVTIEICEHQDQVLNGTSLQHYLKNRDMLNPLLYMELRGIRYDTKQVNKELETTKKEIEKVAESLNEAAGAELRGKKGSLSHQRLADCMYRITPKETKSGRTRKVPEYKTNSYPPQWKTEIIGGVIIKKLTTDIEALLTLRKKFSDDSFLDGIIRHRHLEGLIETLSILPDPDGRVRCGYNVVGAETGRLTCYTSPTGAGANLQTITKKLRKNYIADEGCDFAQYDGAGADGWTVGAHCARLGDPTMLEDYRFGLKPAKVVLLLHLFGSEINSLSREDIKLWSNGEHWKVVTDQYGGPGIYECTKQVYHGTDYQMGIPTMQALVMKKSFKETGIALYLEHRVATELQNCVFTRYRGIPIWHKWGESMLVSTGQLVSASGQVRTFFGRRFGKNIHDTVKEFLAHEPQSNTTYATNLIALNLWNDPENRYKGLVLKEATDTYEATLHGEPGALFIEPLHQVHDALCVQWPSRFREWAKRKMREYSNNTLTIAGYDIVIPFEGKWGRSWGELENDI